MAESAVTKHQSTAPRALIAYVIEAPVVVITQCVVRLEPAVDAPRGWTLGARVNVVRLVE